MTLELATGQICAKEICIGLNSFFSYSKKFGSQIL